MTDDELLARFIASFERLGDLVAWEAVGDRAKAPPVELAAGENDSPWARPLWRPAAVGTAEEALGEFYRRVPVRVPPLYERLVLSYRWLDVELGGFGRLFGNPPGATLEPLAAAMTRDRGLAEVLFPAGLIPFGQAPGDSHDPICFDTARRAADGDCPVVRVEHEAVRCEGRIGETWRVAGKFRGFLHAVVEEAEGK